MPRFLQRAHLPHERGQLALRKGVAALCHGDGRGGGVNWLVVSSALYLWLDSYIVPSESKLSREQHFGLDGGVEGRWRYGSCLW